MSGRKKVDLARKQELLDLENVVRSEGGRRFIARMLERFGVNRSSYSGDPHATAFNEGMRNAGLFLLAELNEPQIQPYYLLLLQEARKAEPEKQAHKEEEQDG